MTIGKTIQTAQFEQIKNKPVVFGQIKTMKLFVAQPFISVDFVFSGNGTVRFISPGKEGKIEDHIPKISAKVGRAENEERLDFLLSLVLSEDAPVAFQSQWEKFIKEQTGYFNKLHPSCYEAGETLRGWEKRSILYQIGEKNQKMYICCPEKMVFSEWRAYDGMKAIYGRLLDKLVDANGETTYVVAPSKDLLMIQDYVEHREGYHICPFVKGNVIALNSHDYGWFWAGVQKPVVEEFLN